MLNTTTGKPEVVVNSTMESVEAFLIDRMLSNDWILKSRSEDTLVFDEFFISGGIPLANRVTYHLFNISNGIRVMTTIYFVNYPDSVDEIITADNSKKYDEASDYQILLETMKYLLETENPGTIGVMLDDKLWTTIELVKKSGPAEKAGLQVGDVIVAIDGMQMTNDPVANNSLFHKQAGTIHEFTIKRKGNIQAISVVYEKIDNIPGKSLSSQSKGSDAVPTDAVFEVESIGAVISNGKIISVTPDGPAKKAGIQKGDVITIIDGDPVSNNWIENVKKLIGETNTAVVVTLKRDDQEITVAVIRKNL